MNKLIVEAPSIEEVENDLLQSEGLEEAKLIPLDKISEEEAFLIRRYLDGVELTDIERDKVKEILTRFRPALHKYNPDEMVKNITKNEDIILSEKEFLEMEDTYDDVVTIPFSYPRGNRIIRMHFDVYPITDSQAVLDIQNNLSMFQDLTEKEANVYQKMQTDEVLSREEQIIKASVEEKINDATRTNTKQIIVEFLSMQCKFAGCDSRYEDMREVFNRIPLLYLALLFQKVQEISKLGNVDTEQVFQEFSN